MTSDSIPEIALSSGGKVSVMALGTAVYPPVGEAIIPAVLEAIRLGVRPFDTASVYLSEGHLGEAVAEALRLSLVSSRAKLFISTKIRCANAHSDLVVPALRKSLQ